MKKILIVDDNRLERKLLFFVLNDAFGNQIEVAQATDGGQAFDMLSERIYDLVVTDLVMPKVEGIELIKKIKNQFDEIVNIIAVSGKNPYYLYLAKKMGIQGVFTKPLDKDKFIYTVENLFSIKSTPQTSVVS
jgi:two-component system response regulator YesN